jgi:hypothetical protein
MFLHCEQGKNAKLRRENIVTALALLVILATMPFAIMDTIETGRVCLFSSKVPEELPLRFTGTGPCASSFSRCLPSCWGLFGLLFHAAHRKGLMQSEVAAISTLLAMGILLDVLHLFNPDRYCTLSPAALDLGPVRIRKGEYSQKERIQSRQTDFFTINCASRFVSALDSA